MTYVHVHYTDGMRFRWRPVNDGVEFTVTDDDARADVTLLLRSPEKVDQLIGDLVQARNELFDRRGEAVVA